MKAHSNSPAYTQTIEITDTVTVKYFSVDIAGNIEIFQSVTYTLDADNVNQEQGSLQTVVDPTKYNFPAEAANKKLFIFVFYIIGVVRPLNIPNKLWIWALDCPRNKSAR